jgi:hypothetical protein
MTSLSSVKLTVLKSCNNGWYFEGHAFEEVSCSVRFVDFGAGTGIDPDGYSGNLAVGCGGHCSAIGESAGRWMDQQRPTGVFKLPELANGHVFTRQPMSAFLYFRLHSLVLFTMVAIGPLSNSLNLEYLVERTRLRMLKSLG